MDIVTDNCRSYSLPLYLFVSLEPIAPPGLRPRANSTGDTRASRRRKVTSALATPKSLISPAVCLGLSVGPRLTHLNDTAVILTPPRSSDPYHPSACLVRGVKTAVALQGWQGVRDFPQLSPAGPCDSVHATPILTPLTYALLILLGSDERGSVFRII